MAPRASSPPDAPEGLPIQDVSRRLGIPAPTIRAWERRYGIPDTPRSAGGHRRYSAESLHQLRLMRDEISRGRRAAEAAESVRRLAAPDQPAADLVARLLEFSTRMEPAGVRAVLDDSADQLGLAGAIDDVLMPALRQVGTWWQTGSCDVAQEHLTTEAVRGWLSARAAFAPGPSHDDSLVFACGPRDLHSVGLEALALLMAYDGWSCRVLGARTPAPSLVAAVRATSAKGVVVVSHLATGRRPAVEAIRAASETRTHVFYAGNAFLFTRARAGLPATYLGESLAGAAAIMRAELAA